MNSANQSPYFDPQNQSPVPFAFSRPMLWLIVTLWLGMNTWSAIVVAHGLSVSRNFSSMPEWSLYVVAAALQAAVAMAPIYLVYLWRQVGWFQRLLWIPLLWFAVVFIVIFECAHQSLVQAKNSQGAEMLNVHRSSLEALRTRVNDLGESIPSMYNTKSNEAAAFAERAAEGRDGTGIARKGPIYRARMAEYDKARVQFGDLTVPIPPLGESGDIQTLLSAIESRVAMLGSRVTRLGDFYLALDKSAAPASITAELAGVEKVLAEKLAMYKGFNDVSERSLAVAETLSIPKRILSGESIPAMYWIAIVYGVAPFIASILFSTYLRTHDTFHRSNGDSVAELQEQLRDEEKKLPLRERLVAIRMKQFGLKIRELALASGKAIRERVDPAETKVEATPIAPMPDRQAA